MKLVVLSIFTMLFSTIFGQNKNELSKKHNSCSHLKAHKTQLNKSDNLNAQDLIKAENYDVKYVELDIEMSNLNKNFSGWASMTSVARVNMDTAIFELHPNYTITQLLVNNVVTPFLRLTTSVRVPVSALLGQSFTIKTFYNGTAPSLGGSALGGAGVTNETSQSWGNQVTWTLSESFGSYEWWPSKMSLRDKIDSCDIHITVPPSCKAGSNGILTSVDTLGSGKLKFNWKHRHPIDYYLISAAVARYIDYTIYANPAGAVAPIKIQNFIYDNPQTLVTFQNEIDATVDYIELFSDLYGLYPFADEKYGHCMAPLGGGMEHQTMTTQGFFQRGLTDHELGHQWWGDNVTCSSWADIWVNEGFASYSEDLMLENLFPADRAAYMNDRHLNIMSELSGSTWVLDSLNEPRIFDSRLTYDKGSAIIHTMRNVINNDAQFFNALKQIQILYKGSTLSGIDVKEQMEFASGLDLTSVFEEWYFGEGYPRYALDWRLDGEMLTLNIKHTASAPIATPTFTTPLEIKINRTIVADTIVRFNIPSNDVTYTFDLNGGVTNFTIDPNNYIINKIGLIQNNPNLSIDEQLLAKKDLISIYPNPTSDYLTFSSDYEKGTFALVNTKGKNVKSGTIVKKDQQIDISSLAIGTYVFTFTTPKGEIINKLVVKK
jgi:aminopeptidase N